MGEECAEQDTDMPSVPATTSLQPKAANKERLQSMEEHGGAWRRKEQLLQVPWGQSSLYLNKAIHPLRGTKPPESAGPQAHNSEGQ